MGHTATYDPIMRCIYIFGGSKNCKWFHDVHMYDLDENKWTLVKVKPLFVYVFMNYTKFFICRKDSGKCYDDIFLCCKQSAKHCSHLLPLKGQ